MNCLEYSVCINMNEQNSNLESSPAEHCLDCGPGVPPDGQEEHDVRHDENHRINEATCRVFVGHFSLDHERHEIGEK